MDIRGAVLTGSGRENEIELALGAVVAPLLERVDDHRGEGDVPFAGLCLRRPHVAPGVCTLAYMDHAGIKVDVGPPQAAQFAEPHTGEYRGDEERAPTPGGVIDQGIKFCHRREIDPGPQGPCVAFPIVRS